MGYFNIEFAFNNNKTLKSIDVIFLYLFLCYFDQLFISHGDLSVIIENITNLTFVECLFGNLANKVCGNGYLLFFKSIKNLFFIFVLICIIITAISFVLPTSFEESLQEQRFRGFSDFGSSLAGNLIFGKY